MPAIATTPTGHDHSHDPAREPVLVIENLSFGYDGPPVVSAPHVCIHQGEFVCIVGPNGGGKTTLVKLILGLLVPQQGVIRVLGRSPFEARRHIGYMPQHAKLDAQFPVTTLDVVLMGRVASARLFGGYSRRDRDAAQGALRDVGLDTRANDAFSALSGGQRQRALIARALVCEPRLLLLDEPTANLDVQVQAEFYELLNQLNQRMTIVMVSHDVRFVSERVQRVICVNRSIHTHPTSELTVESISRLFGHPVRVIRHDHDEARHQH